MDIRSAVCVGYSRVRAGGLCIRYGFQQSDRYKCNSISTGVLYTNDMKTTITAVVPPHAQQHTHTHIRTRTNTIRGLRLAINPIPVRVLQCGVEKSNRNGGQKTNIAQHEHTFNVTTVAAAATAAAACGRRSIRNG